MLKSLSFMLFLFCASSVAAQTTSGYSKNCKTNHITYQHGQMIFNTGQNTKTSVYILHNIGKQTYTLDHRPQHPSASAGWGSMLSPGHWSAISIKQANFSMQCRSVSSSKIVDCKKVVNACEMSALPAWIEDTQGWLAENQSSLKEVLAAVQKRLWTQNDNSEKLF